jgi:hypothetical protein
MLQTLQRRIYSQYPCRQNKGDSVCTCGSGNALGQLVTKSVNGSTLQTIGTCTLKANQARDSQYNAATQVSQSFTVTSALPTQTISGFNPSSPITFSPAP